jgi:type II secretory pathway pseudopilin PulG
MKPRPITFRRAFTIMELIVAVAIVVLLITSVGIVFRSTSRSVGVSQSLMDLLSNSAAIQAQMEADVASINKNGFLVIRSNTFTDNTDPNLPITRRCDQIAFLATGNFQHRGGTTAGNGVPGPLIDPVTAPNALVWWGQLALSQGSGAAAAPTVPTQFLNADQTSANKVPLNQVPTGANESDYTLGRSAILMIPNNNSNNSPTTLAMAGVTVPAYQNSPTQGTPTRAAIDYLAPAVRGAASTLENTTADITQSRVDLAATFPEQVMAFITQAVTINRASSDARYEADHFCYRRAALRSPYDTELDSNGNANLAGTRNIGNGYFRMHTIALQGVPTFAVEWTDGSVYAANDIDPVTTTDPTNPKKLAATSPLIGTTRWYGMNNAQCGNNALGIVDPSGTALTYSNPTTPLVTYPTAGTSLDPYTAVFSFDNKSKWPVALRFRYHIVDPTNRLPNGREVIQVIKLPS